MVRKNLLGHLIRVRRAMMVTKTEMNASNDEGSMTTASDYKASMMCSEETYWGTLTRVRWVMMMAKTEMNNSDDKERVIWSKRTHWEIGSECEG